MVYNKYSSMRIADRYARIGSMGDMKMEENPAVPTPNADGKKKSEALDWLQTIVSALVIASLVFTFLARTIVVVGSSMVPTLEEGHLIVVTKLFYKPKYGDIVVLRKASFKDEPIVKRTIATEGQTVDIDFEAGVVYVDGVALDEPYGNAPTLERESFTEPVTVPEGCIFVMGDNRNRSTDSRSASIGCVDTRDVIGRAILRIAPLGKFGKIG